MHRAGGSDREREAPPGATTKEPCGAML